MTRLQNRVIPFFYSNKAACDFRVSVVHSQVSEIRARFQIDLKFGLILLHCSSIERLLEKVLKHDLLLIDFVFFNLRGANKALSASIQDRQGVLVVMKV